MKIFKNGKITLESMEELNQITGSAQWGILNTTYNFNKKLPDSIINEPVFIYNGLIYEAAQIERVTNMINKYGKGNFDSMFTFWGAKGITKNKELVKEVKIIIKGNN